MVTRRDIGVNGREDISRPTTGLFHGKVNRDTSRRLHSLLPGKGIHILMVGVEVDIPSQPLPTVLEALAAYWLSPVARS